MEWPREEAVHLLTFAEQQGLRPDVVSYSTVTWIADIGSWVCIAENWLPTSEIGLLNTKHDPFVCPHDSFFHGAIVEPCCTTVVPMFVFGIVSICQYSISLYFYVFAMPRADVCWRVACCEAMGAASKDWQIAVGLFQAMADGQGSVGEPIVELIRGDYRIFFVITYCSLFFPLIGYKNHIEIEWNWCY